MIKVVIYDCDGVIVNSSNSILTFYNKMMMKCGLPPIDWSEKDLKEKALSMADKDILEVLSKGDKSLYEKMLNISKSGEIQDSFTEMTMVEDFEVSLKMVKEKSIPMAVLTNRGRSLPLLLKHFKIYYYFDMLVTSADVDLPKPSPEGILKICDKFNVYPKDVLFIGDSPSDYQAAKNCGANFLAFKTPLYDSLIMNNHKEILHYIEKVFV